MQGAYNSFLMKFTNIGQKILQDGALGLCQAKYQIILIVEGLKLRHLDDGYQ